jgi:hypothetical protein
MSIKLKDLMPFIGNHEIQLNNAAQICGVSSFSVVSRHKSVLFAPLLNIPEYTVGLLAEQPAWNLQDFGKQPDVPIEYIHISETEEQALLGFSTTDQWEDCLYAFPKFLVCVRLEKSL